MRVKFWRKGLSNIHPDAKIGEGCIIHAHVDIHNDVIIGKNCKIQAGAFIPNGVRIGNNVFVGPHVVFTNDPYFSDDWTPVETHIEDNVKIGANSTIKAGITIGNGVIIGMGSVVTKDIPAGQLWFGNPAKFAGN